MDKKHLKRANDILKYIDIIKKNIDNVKNVSRFRTEFDNDAHIRLSDGNSEENLISDFLVIPLKEFIIIYISRAEQKIRELEEEFEKL